MDIRIISDLNCNYFRYEKGKLQFQIYLPNMKIIHQFVYTYLYSKFSNQLISLDSMIRGLFV
jgi:hypothetical protein